MAILINQSNNNNSTSGETLLASSSLENTINEARNLSVSIDSKIADLKNKVDEFKQESDVTLTAVFAKLDKKEKSFNTNVNKSADDAANKIGKAVNELREGSEIIKNVSKTTSTIITHIVLFIIELAVIFYLALPTIKQAKEVLTNNRDVLKISFETKKENEKLRKENQGLNDELISLNGFVNAIFKDKERARREYQKWKSSYN
mgnify:CR=1 FL=1